MYVPNTLTRNVKKSIASAFSSNWNSQPARWSNPLKSTPSVPENLLDTGDAGSLSEVVTSTTCAFKPNSWFHLVFCFSLPTNNPVPVQRFMAFPCISYHFLHPVALSSSFPRPMRGRRGRHPPGTRTKRDCAGALGTLPRLRSWFLFHTWTFYRVPNGSFPSGLIGTSWKMLVDKSQVHCLLYLLPFL